MLNNLIEILTAGVKTVLIYLIVGLIVELFIPNTFVIFKSGFIVPIFALTIFSACFFSHTYIFLYLTNIRRNSTFCNS